MAEISFKQADMDINKDHIEKLNKEIEELKKKRRKYEERNKKLELFSD